MAGQPTPQFREEVLLKEYLRICEDIRAIQSNNDRVVGLAIALASAGTAVGFVSKFSAVFLLLPFVIIGVLFFGVMTYMWIFSMGGYKRYLEDLINATIRERLLLWETLVERRKTFDIPRNALVSLYVLTAAAITSSSVFNVYQIFGWAAGSFIALVAVISFFVLLFSWKQMQTVSDFIYNTAVQEHRDFRDVGDFEKPAMPPSDGKSHPSAR